MKAKNELRMLTSEELSFFTGQVALMLNSGIPIYESIEVLAGNYRNTPYEEAFKLIYASTDRGEQLSAAMAQTGIFPRYAVKMAEIGENTGRLEQVMSSLSRHYAREDFLTASLKNALRYPAMLLGIMAVVVVIINWKVLPLFRHVLTNLGTDNSGFTRAAMKAGTVIGIVAVALVVLMIGASLALSVCIKNGRLNNLITRLGKCFSSVASLQKAVSAERFLSVLSISLKAGCSPETALDSCVELIDDEDSLKRVHSIKAMQAENGSLAEAISKSELLDPLKARMIGVGFMTGKADEVTEHVAKLYAESTDEKLERLLSMIEPALITVLAIIIGCVLLTVMLPLAGVMSSFL